MKVAVCCPGPSLPTTWMGRHPYDAVWAVNRALIVVDADWLSAGDPPIFDGLLPPEAKPRLGVITMKDTLVRFKPMWPDLLWHSWEEYGLMDEHAAFGRPLSWSVQAALCHAFALGAKRIDLFGCDGVRSTTTIDCTGYAGEDRSQDRWQREALDLGTTYGILGACGVTFNHIHPKEHEHGRQVPQSHGNAGEARPPNQ